MASPPLRFVQTGDLHLETPLHGVAEIPESLRDAFVDAPYQAAEKVFDAVLAEDAHFLLLCGDVLDPHSAGARGILFLVDQFERLAESDVPVYWVGGSVDPPDAWPSSAPLPENVHVFPRGRPTETLLSYDERPAARICGGGRGGPSLIHAGDFATIDDGVFSIAVAHGEADENALTQRPIDYWALGGRHERQTLATSPVAVHYAGSPQGRCPAETGQHGCTLVDVDEARQTTLKLIPTDSLQWQSERLVLDADANERKLEEALRERTHRLIAAAGGRHLMISWTVAGNSPVIAALRRGKLADELLSKLRAAFGQQTAAAWTVAIEAEAPAEFPNRWYQEDTMLGEFLRNASRLRAEPAEQIDLQRYIGAEHAKTAVAAAVAINDAETRQTVLHQAAILGVDLLRGEEASS